MMKRKRREQKQKAFFFDLYIQEGEKKKRYCNPRSKSVMERRRRVIETLYIADRFIYRETERKKKKTRQRESDVKSMKKKKKTTIQNDDQVYGFDGFLLID